MSAVHFPVETGGIRIEGHKFTWTMKRTKGESCFGIKGSRVFELELKKDNNVVGIYRNGWEQKIPEEDSVSKLAIEYILNTYGKEKKKSKPND